MRMKNAIPLLLVLTIAATGLAGCGKTTTDAPVSGTPTAEDLHLEERMDETVLTVNGRSISYESYRQYYFTVLAAMGEEEQKVYTDASADKETQEKYRTLVVREIVRDQIILELAEGFGVLPGEEEEAEVDAAIESIKKNVVSTGLTYEEYLARFYRTPEVQRAGMLLNNYTYGAVFGYLYDRNHAVIDRSPETIRAQMAKTGCSLRLVLDGSVYRLEAARKLAQSLRALITDAWEYAETVSDKATALSALTGFLADYDRAAAENSMVSSFEEYANRQRLLKELLESGSAGAALTGLQTAAEQVSGASETLADIKAFAKNAGENQADAATCQELFRTYKQELEDWQRDFFNDERDSEPSSKERNLLFALQTVSAALTDLGSSEKENVVQLTKNLLSAAFGEAVQTYSAYRQNVETGEYFLKEEAEESFYKEYEALKAGELSQPVSTSYGTELILRLECDYDYYAESIYDDYAVNAWIQDRISKAQITYGELFELVNFENLK